MRSPNDAFTVHSFSSLKLYETRTAPWLNIGPERAPHVASFRALSTAVVTG